jgi:laminin alpha 3/5
MWLPQLLLAVALLGLKTVHGVILTPPYFNLAEGRRIYATATCGEEIQEPELYCKLVGANADRDVNVNLIQGQVSFEKNTQYNSKSTENMRNLKSSGDGVQH